MPAASEWCNVPVGLYRFPCIRPAGHDGPHDERGVASDARPIILDQCNPCRGTGKAVFPISQFDQPCPHCGGTGRDSEANDHPRHWEDM